jgi:sialate O-acetylesterase
MPTLRIPALLILFIAFHCISPLASAADLKLPPAISDHMVLQREMPVPIWGTATAGESISVKFRDQQKTATADKNGKWFVKLDALKPGGPDELIVAGKESLTIHDVLVGDVWVGSGQSNMGTLAGGYEKNDPELAKILAAAPYPQVRIINRGPWKESTAANLRSFSALHLSFGIPLQKEIGVPVGLMVGAVGGTPSGAWLSPEMFAADAACQEQVKQAMATYDPKAEQAKYEQQLAAWKQAVEKAKAAGDAKLPQMPRPPGKPGELANQKMGYLYAAHIQPYQPYAIKGVLWDQGESGTAVRGVDQYVLMGALIKGWRNAWGQGDFPFIYVQKPSGGGCAWNYSDPVTAKADKFIDKIPAAVPSGAEGVYRETHLKIRKYPNTFLVISSDLGPGTHPINKSGYGARAARVAMGAVYGKKIEIYGPMYETMKVEGDKIRVSFSHAGQGLAFKNGDKLQGFAVAGDDKKFQWADATIDGDTVVVHSDRVAKPVAVRYAWSQTHPWANLFNKDGLPAVTFRSDE